MEFKFAKCDKTKVTANHFWMNVPTATVQILNHGWGGHENNASGWGGGPGWGGGGPDDDGEIEPWG